MFAAKKPDERAGLQKTIDDLLRQMTLKHADSEEYAKMADQLVKLYPLREKDSPQRISPDTFVTVLGNLLGIILIVGHERAHVVTSKALTFVQKLK